MILCIDIGNTNIKVALFDEDAPSSRPAISPAHVWRISSEARRTKDEYLISLASLLSTVSAPISASASPAQHASRPPACNITRAAISSVVPALTGVLCAVCKELTGCDAVVINPSMRLPVTLPESAKHEIGSDLLCDAVEVYSRSRAPCIVCDAGTALSFVAVAGDGEVAGVAIAPGINTALSSLVGGTAQLYSVPLLLPPASLGRNTTEALQSGVVLGYTHLVRGLLGEMKRDLLIKEQRRTAGNLAGESRTDSNIASDAENNTECAQDFPPPPDASHSSADKNHIIEGKCTTYATGGLLLPIRSIFDVVDMDITLCGIYRALLG